MTKIVSIIELSQAIYKIAGVNEIQQVSKDVISNFPKPTSSEHVALYKVQDSNNVVWY